MNRLSVLMTTEGTYPYGSGGVSTWCDAILRNTPDVSYFLLPLMMNPHIERRYQPPKNVRRIINVPLWGTEEPAEFISGMLFRDVYDRKRKTSDEAIEHHFSPLLERFLRIVNDGGSDPEAFGNVLLSMEDYFRRFDYNDTFKAQPTWQTFRRVMEELSRNRIAATSLPGSEHRMPTLFDLTEALRWLYRFLTVLNVRVPAAAVSHSTAAAFCGIPCITAKIRRGTPMILTEHGVYLREQNLFLSRFRRLFFCKEFLLNLITAVVRANYHFADVVSPVCHYNTRWEVAHGAPQTKIRVIYNGVDPDVFTPVESTGSVHIVTTARIDRLKDIETLLRVAAEVHSTHPTALFTVYGSVADDAYYAECQALHRELKLGGIVEMGRATDDVARALRDADIVLLTSISEAFPYSILEAMSSGRPVVASDVGGVSEAVEGCGTLVKPRDVAGFTAAIRQLLDDTPLRRRLGAKARERVLEEFRLDRCIASYLDLYRQLASQRTAA
jgi:glycosyltransferase involved in cell wall biosynthesis